MSTGPALILSGVLLGLNAFFVGAEFALVSARRSAVELLAAEGRRAAQVTLRAMEQVSLMMAAAQLGITVCSLGLGYLGEPAIAHAIEPAFEAIGMPEDALHPVAFAIALAIVTFLHVVFGEMVPKNIALAGPDRVALLLAPPLVAVVGVLGPAIIALNRLSNAILRRFGVEPRDEVASAFTRDEVAHLVADSRREGLLDENEEQLVVGALGFEDRDITSVLLPIAELETVPSDITPAQLEQVAARTGYSRFPVHEGNDLVGYLHVKDVLEFEDRHRNRPIARAWIRDLHSVAPDAALYDVLTRMQRSGTHLACVRQRDRPLGVVALEDVVEELVGEIRDDAASRS